MNLARLNHILIPSTKQGRDRLRRGFVGKLAWPGMWLYSALSSEGRVLAVVTLVLGAAALDVYGTRLYLLWSALCGLLLAGLLLRRAFRLEHVRLEARMPARIVLGASSSCELRVHNRGHRTEHSLRLLGPFLPWDGRWLEVPPGVGALEPGQSARLVARAVFTDRGDHHLDPFAVTALVPLGLAAGPALLSEGCRFRVVPRIATVAELTLPVCDRYQPGGIAHASVLGESRELCGVRPYRRGDPVRDLHALTWARTGTPHVREYQQEYYRRVAVVLDVDAAVTSERGLEALVSLAAGVVARLTADDALVDLLVADAHSPAVTIGRSLGSIEQALDLLAIVRRSRGFDAMALRSRLAPALAQLSGLYLLTEHALFDERPGRLERLWAELGAKRRRAGGERRAFVDELERAGLCVRVLRLVRRPVSTTEAAKQESLVPMAAVERQEALWL